jgi:hypothetical protein
MDGGDMRKVVSLVVFGLLAMPLLAANETFTDVAVVDVNCSKKVAADPDSHTRACALKCQESGFGIVTKDKQFLKLDANGNAQVIAALKASDKKDHLRADVTGDVQGDRVKVNSFQLR